MAHGALHIAYVSTDRGIPVPGTKGGSTHVRELVNALAGRGARVDVLTTRATDGARPRGLDAEVTDVFDGFSRGIRDQIRRIAPGVSGEVIAGETTGLLVNHELYLRLHALHARRRIDAIYERYALWGYGGLRFARDAGLPFLLEVNAPLRLEQAQYRALRNAVVAEALEAELFHCADRVLVPSEALRGYVIARGGRPGRVRVVPNAADPAFFRPPPSTSAARSPFVIGFVGSLKPWHGIEDLLRAFVRLRRQSSDYRLLIVGDGPLRSVIEQTQRRAGLGDAIRVTGSVAYEEVRRLLWEMDVAVAPYPRLAGFYFSPLKIYEYMAAGRPIVASAIGQVAEVLTHRRTALLHPPGSVRKLVEHVEELRRRPRLRERLGREARRLAVKRFTWDRNAARVLAMVETIRRHASDR